MRWKARASYRGVCNLVHEQNLNIYRNSYKHVSRILALLKPLVEKTTI